MIDKQKRQQLGQLVEEKYLSLWYPKPGEGEFAWLLNLERMNEFMKAWEDLKDYYKGHPDGVLDATVVFIYAEFSKDLHKLMTETTDVNLHKKVNHLRRKLDYIVDELLAEATNSAHNFPEYT
jgi:hypothetical protein